jgi:hypothetical protein
VSLPALRVEFISGELEQLLEHGLVLVVHLDRGVIPAPPHEPRGTVDTG